MYLELCVIDISIHNILREYWPLLFWVLPTQKDAKTLIGLAEMQTFSADEYIMHNIQCSWLIQTLFIQNPC